jgi:hypothetical protein
MELMGRVKAYDEKAKPHEFTVYRRPNGYIIQLDGEEIRTAATNLDAIAVILEEAEKRGYRRGPGT